MDLEEQLLLTNSPLDLPEFGALMAFRRSLNMVLASTAKPEVKQFKRDYGERIVNSYDEGRLRAFLDGKFISTNEVQVDNEFNKLKWAVRGGALGPQQKLRARNIILDLERAARGYKSKYEKSKDNINN